MKPSLPQMSAKSRSAITIARGTLAIRSHVDVCDERLVGVEALVELREEMKPWIDIQLVAFPQDGLYRFPNAPELVARALDRWPEIEGYKRTDNLLIDNPHERARIDLFLFFPYFVVDLAER